MTTTYQITASRISGDPLALSSTGEWHASPVSPFETSDEDEARAEFDGLDAATMHNMGWRGPVTVYLERIENNGDDVEMEVIAMKEIEA